MKHIAAIIGLLSLFSTLAFAANQYDHKMKFVGIQTITPNVDRLLNQSGNSIATVFCTEEVASVMVVDNGPLDGKRFFFENPQVCAESRANAKKYLKKCSLHLGLQMKDMKAALLFSDCQE